MGIGWHNEQGGPGVDGRHRQPEPSYAPGVWGRQGGSIEPQEDFDWASVEDRAGELMEEMLAEKLPLTRPQAEAAMRIFDRWMAKRGLNQIHLVHRILDWIAGADMAQNGRSDADCDKRFGARVAVSMREMNYPPVVARMTMRALGKAFGVSHVRLVHLTKSFRAHFRQ